MWIPARVAKELDLPQDEAVSGLCWHPLGHRLATWSLDGTIKVWDRKVSGEGPWKCTEAWKGHEGTIRKLVWAPPTFGDVVASASDDRTIGLWEERSQGDEVCRWRLCTRFEESSVDVLDVKFVSTEIGLKLISAAADGQVRVYVARGIMDLKSWQLEAEFSVLPKGKDVRRDLAPPCLGIVVSWNTSPLVAGLGGPPTMVVGWRCESAELSGAKIWEYSDAFQRWHAVADIFVQGEEPLAANDIAWAPNLGRLFDLIGVGSVDGISIWRVDYPSYSDPSYADGCPIVKRVAHFRNHQAEVWKVEWDMTGTTLASSGDDGTVRCWKADVAGTWYQRAIVGGAKDLEELQGDGMSG